MAASASNFPKKLRALLQQATSWVALAAVLAIPGLAWADSCSTLSPSFGSITCTIAGANPKAALSLALTGVAFTAPTQGIMLFYDDFSHSLLSNILAFSNIGDVATLGFASDADDIPVTAQGLPISGQFTAIDKPVFISVALGNGRFLRAKICGDEGASTGCSGESGSIGFSIGKTSIPEPGTFVLLGSGLVGTGAWRLASRRFRTRAQLAAASRT